LAHARTAGHRRPTSISWWHGISLPPRPMGEYIDRLFTNTLDPDAHRGGLGDMDMM
jgi:hypothetical protein